MNNQERQFHNNHFRNSNKIISTLETINITLSNLDVCGGEGSGSQGIQGVQGVPGNDGATGNQGIQGVPGNDGATGNQGIPGNDGADGADGIGIGIQGPQGPQGETGQHGHNGTDGIDGTNGVDGADGTNGVDGADGIDGTNGTNGIDGTNGSGGGGGGTTIPTYTKSNLPITSTNGSQAFITDGMSDNTWCMGYFYLGEWYRTFDNSLIEDETAPFITNIVYFSTPNDNTTPTISFHCNEVGYLESSLSFTSTTTITNGNNIITFNIPIGLYANQTITINDIQGNYTTVVIPEFQITTPPDLIPPVITVINYIPTTGINTQPTMTFHSNEVGTIASSLAILSPSPPNIIVGNNTITFDLSVGPYSGEAITICDTNNNDTTINLPAFGITAEPTSGYDTTALDSINKLGWWSAYDTDDFVVDTNNVVMGWMDKTGNNNNLQQVDNKDTTRSSTEGEGVAFNGSSSLTNNDFNISANVPYTLVLVFEKESSASLSWLIDSIVVDSGRNTVYSNSQGYITTHRRLGNQEPNYSFSIYTNNNSSTNVKDILTINFDGPNDSSISAHSNTQQNGVFTTGSLGTGEMDGITVGSLYNGASGYGIDGKIYEIIYFDGIINTVETTTIRDYLTTKWSI